MRFLLGAIVLSLYYLFLWNPYGNEKAKNAPTALASTSARNSNHQLLEPMNSAANLQAPTVSTLLNATAVIISTTKSLMGRATNRPHQMTNLSTPKALAYKQKGNRERLAIIPVKKSNSVAYPFQAKSHSNSKTLTNAQKLDPNPTQSNVYKRIGSNIMQNSVDDKNVAKRRVSTLDIRDINTESAFGIHKIKGKPFYLEDPFTTYAKGN